MLLSARYRLPARANGRWDGFANTGILGFDLISPGKILVNLYINEQRMLCDMIKDIMQIDSVLNELDKEQDLDTTDLRMEIRSCVSQMLSNRVPTIKPMGSGGVPMNVTSPEPGLLDND